MAATTQCPKKTSWQHAECFLRHWHHLSITSACNNMNFPRLILFKMLIFVSTCSIEKLTKKILLCSTVLNEKYWWHAVSDTLICIDSLSSWHSSCWWCNLLSSFIQNCPPLFDRSRRLLRRCSENRADVFSSTDWLGISSLIIISGRYSAALCLDWHPSNHSVHLMNVVQRLLAASPQTKPIDLGCESTCSLPFTTPTIARRLILILPFHRG